MTSRTCTVGYDVVVNRPKVAAYRAPSAPMAAFAVESTMDLVAKAIDMDPVGFPNSERREEGFAVFVRSDLWSDWYRSNFGCGEGTPAHEVQLRENQGRGMACGFWFNFGGQTCTSLNIGIDGTVNLTVGTVDVGGSRASLSLIAAEELGIPYDKVKCFVGDTGTLGHNDTTDGSRGTFHRAWRPSLLPATQLDTVEGARRKCGKSVDDIEWKTAERSPIGTEHSNLAHTHSRRNCGQVSHHRRTYCGSQRGGCGRRRCLICKSHLRRGSRSDDGGDQDCALHRDPGRRSSHSSGLCGRSIPRWSGAGHWLGAE